MITRREAVAVEEKQLANDSNQLGQSTGAAASLLAAALDTAGISLAVLDDGKVAAANRVLHELLGYGPDALLGLEWQQIVAPQRHRTFERLSGLIASGTSGQLYYELMLLGAAGNTVIVEVTHSAVSLAEFKGQVLALTPPRRNRPLETAEYLAPICSRCGNIRDDHDTTRGTGKWISFLDYVSTYELGRVTHSLCPDCATWLLNSK